MNYVQLGKEISYVLRHHPEKYNLDIDNEGWVDVGDLLNALESRFGLLKEEDIVALMQQSEKERYELKNHRIRAYYGHSFSKKIMKQRNIPPKVLYHGTARRFVSSILTTGLQPMSRQYVHLSQDVETAKQVGMRHDTQPVILMINAQSAFQDGVAFYLGNEKVWLSETIPSQYIEERKQ